MRLDFDICVRIKDKLIGDSISVPKATNKLNNMIPRFFLLIFLMEYVTIETDSSAQKVQTT